MAWTDALKSTTANGSISSNIASKLGERAIGSSLNEATYGEYELIGFNANAVGHIKAVITAYRTALNTEINQLNERADSNNVFRGRTSDDVDAVQNAVKNYIIKVQDLINKYVSYIDAFNDQLSDVEKAYQASMGNLSENINSSSADIDSFQGYTSQSGNNS